MSLPNSQNWDKTLQPLRGRSSRNCLHKVHLIWGKCHKRNFDSLNFSLVSKISVLVCLMHWQSRINSAGVNFQSINEPEFCGYPGQDWDSIHTYISLFLATHFLLLLNFTAKYRLKPSKHFDVFRRADSPTESIALTNALFFINRTNLQCVLSFGLVSDRLLTKPKPMLKLSSDVMIVMAMEERRKWRRRENRASLH